MRWGLAGGVAIASVDEARRVARYADESGFDGLWISHATAVDPIVALACVSADIPHLGEVGTSVVPLYGRHPIGLAQLARTAQSALGGRFTLGIGAASAAAVRDRMGMAWERPLTFTREFIDGLQPLLAGEQADVDGSQVTTHAQLDVEAPGTPILLAALGPRMLDLAGRQVAGTSVGQCGPRTIAGYIRPTIDAAAEAAGRPRPRVMALVRVSVTDDLSDARAHAVEIARRYGAIPSYAAVQAKEGVDDPADLHLIGSWEQILDGLAAYADAGVTDLRIEAATHTPEARQATMAAMAEHLNGSGRGV